MSGGKNDADGDVSNVRVVVQERVRSVDPRAHAAWRRWLGTLAHDADAVTAAVLAYESLDDAGRDAWLDALDADAAEIRIPRVALYAPLLGVEQDERRRARMAKNLDGAAKKSAPPRALVARVPNVHGEHVCLVVTPLYLDFVELLFCRYDQDEGVREARHRWLTHVNDVTIWESELGVNLSDAPLSLVVEELAHAIVADRRAGRKAPSALVRCMDLFAPDLSFGGSFGHAREPMRDAVGSDHGDSDE